ncbi:hypothetical protein XENTR_v10012892 [Xenopus tropicalis]|nr:hypothetical protein XENTR_v10012892 [Xenopus tropicalis]
MTKCNFGYGLPWGFFPMWVVALFLLHAGKAPECHWHSQNQAVQFIEAVFIYITNARPALQLLLNLGSQLSWKVCSVWLSFQNSWRPLFAHYHVSLLSLRQVRSVLHVEFCTSRLGPVRPVSTPQRATF